MTQETLEEAIFKTLSHQKRRDILRFIGEKTRVTFGEIKTAAEMPDTPTLSYHLNALDGLIVQDQGRYGLSELGKDAYNLICKTQVASSSHSIIALLRKELTLVIVTNAILWAIAIFATSVIEGRLQQLTLSTLGALWFMSNIILYTILKSTRKQSTSKNL